MYLWGDYLNVKPYLLQANYAKKIYPNPNYETPDHIKYIMDVLGKRYYGSRYNPKNNVVPGMINNVVNFIRFFCQAFSNPDSSIRDIHSDVCL